MKYLASYTISGFSYSLVGPGHPYKDKDIWKFDADNNDAALEIAKRYIKGLTKKHKDNPTVDEITLEWLCRIEEEIPLK